MEAEIVQITESLISEISGCASSDFHDVKSLDLHLRGSRRGKIRKIESLHLVPNLRTLNLSYNIISVVEGLSRLPSLVELNLAENSISSIEGLQHLRCLERLNLSGNRIQRLPESMAQLTSLSHFRIARNKLSVLADIRFLSSLDNLKTLRIDDNPIMQQSDAIPYTIFNIRSLVSLNGLEITNKDRNEARRSFASDEISDLRSRIAAEQHQLAKLKRDLQNSPERAAVLHPTVPSSVEQMETFDQQNLSLAAKLQAIQETEFRIMQLKSRLLELEEDGPKATEEPDTGSTPTAQHFQRLRGNTHTPSASISPSIPSPQFPPADAASQHIADLSSRVERLASKVLATEQEKQHLQSRLDSQRSVMEGVNDLQQELNDCELRLGEALHAAQEANSQLLAREEELSTATQIQKEQESRITTMEANLRLVTEEREQLRAELHFLRAQEGPRQSQEDWRTQEKRADMLKQRMLIEELESKNAYLAKELEERLRQMATLTDSLVKSQQEEERWKQRVHALQSETDRKIARLEEERATFLQHTQHLTQDLSTLGADRETLRVALRKAQADLEAMMKATRSSPIREELRLHPTRSSRRKLASSAYLQTASSDSDETSESNQDAECRSPSHQGESSKAVRSPKGAPPADVAFGVIERRAAGIMSHTLMEELQHCPPHTFPTAHSRGEDSLKQACIRTVLRLLGSSKFPASSSSEAIPPWHALAGRDNLSTLVAETLANMAAIEDSDSIKEEIKHLESIVGELERKATLLDQSITEKENVVKTLERQGGEARRQAENTLTELEQMSLRLQSHRNELLQLNAQQQLKQRELEINKSSLQEISSIHQLEQSNLQSLRDKALQAKQELTTVEQQVQVQRDLLRKEEQRLKNLKYIAQEQIQRLHQEVTGLESAVVVKQQGLAELESLRKQFEDDLDSKQRDVYYHKQQLTQQVNDEAQKLHQLKNDTKLAQMAYDQALSRQRQLEVEVQKLQELLSSETNRLEFVKMDYAKKVEVLEKQVAHAEKQLKTLKDASVTLENDQILLTHSVEDLRRQQYEVEKMKGQRHKAAENELATLQHQIQLNQRLVKQSALQMEQKQHELDILSQECQMAESKATEARKVVAQQDLLVLQQRETLRQLEYEISSLQRDEAQLRKGQETIKAENLSLKSQLQGYHSQHDELKRRVALLAKQEETVLAHENQIQIALQRLKQELDEMRKEHDHLAGAKDQNAFLVKDLESRKMHLENEVKTLENRISHYKERLSGDFVRKDEANQKVLGAVEELHRLQKEVLSAEQRLRTSEERQKHMELQEQMHKAAVQKLVTEAASLKEQYHREKQQVDRLRDESRDLSLALGRSKDELASLEQDVQSRRLLLEQSKLVHGQVEQQKHALELELQQLKEHSQRELSRIDHLEATYQAVNERLSKLRDELIRAESVVDQTRAQSKEEQQKVEQYQDLLSSSAEELRRLQQNIEASRNQLITDRQRAVEDMTKLEQAKAAVGSRIVRMEEAARQQESRLHSQHLAAGGRPSALAAPVRSTLEKQSRPVPGVRDVRKDAFHTAPWSSSLPAEPRQEVSRAQPTSLFALNTSGGSLENPHDESSMSDAAVPTQLQHAVEMLRKQSLSAIASVHLQ